MFDTRVENISKYITVFFILSLFVLYFNIFIISQEEGIKLLLLFSSAVLFLASIFNFYLTFILLLATLFIPHIIIVHQVVFLTFLVFLSLLINFSHIKYKDIKNPILKSLIIYFIAILPSFYNSLSILLSLRDLLNLLAMIVAFLISLIAIKNKDKIILSFSVFIGAVFLHSLYVIYLGITTGKRVFGLLNVYYIDFAGLGSLLTFILLLYGKKEYKIFYAIAFLVISIGLILTQTRNAWISTGFGLLSLLGYLFIKTNKVYVKRYISLSVAILMLGITIAFTVYSGSGVTERIDGQSQSVVLTDNPETSNVNSFVTRAMIWHTAFNAFLKHPILGIGAYSFKHSSQAYYEIPKGFFDLFVVGRTPHITYLQVLTETGIWGLIFFLLFILSIIKYLLHTLRDMKQREDVKVSLLIVWSFVYIIFSMIMTESWLYGQYAVWVGILLGFLVNNRNRLASDVKL